MIRLRHFLFVLSLIVSLLWASLTVAAAKIPTPQLPMLTLEEAIMLSLRYNPSMQSAEIQRVVDKFSLRVAQWNYEVQYALNGAASYTNSVSGGKRGESNSENLIPSASLLTPVGTQMNLAFANPISHTAGSPSFYNPSVTFTMTQPLLKGFGPDVVLAPFHQAEFQELLNRLTLKNTAIGTVTTVISQYVTVVQAKNTVTANQLALNLAEATLRQAQAMVKAGRSAPADVVQFQSTVANSILAVQQAEVSLMQAKLGLLTDLGLDPNLQFDVPNKVDFTDQKIPSLCESIRLALLDNIAYQQQLISVKLAKITLLLALDAQRTQLNFTATRVQGGGSGGKPNSGLDSLVNGQNQSTALGLQLSVPIDNLSLQQQLVAAKVGLQQQEINLEAQERLVVNATTNAYQTVLSQRQQIQQALDAVKYAEKNVFIAQTKLKYGLVSPFEASTQQSNLTTAQLNYIDTVAAYITNLANFDQTVGTTLDRWAIKIRY